MGEPGTGVQTMLKAFAKLSSRIERAAGTGGHSGDSAAVSKYVRVLWCDAAGVRRCRVLPYSTYTLGVGLTKGCMAMPAHADSCIADTGLGPVGEIRLLPDPTTVTRLPWHPSHAVALADMYDGPGTPWAVCPRTSLKRALAHAEAKGVRLLVGFELEFVLLRRDPQGNLAPIDRSVYCQSSALDAAADVLDEIVDALDKMGIPIVQFHPESAPGQFEVALSPHNPLEAADKLLLAKEAVAAVACRHGLEASFHPKTAAKAAGNGCHCHFSLVDEAGRNVMLAAEGEQQAGTGLSVQAEAFAAGVLHHLPGLLPWTSPSAASYYRLVPCCWAGAYRCWGRDNREAPLRLTGSDASTNFECKTFDGTTNPHLGLAALVVAGVAGLEAGSKLPEELTKDPYNLSEEERQAVGADRLPSNLQEAVEAAEKDTQLLDALKQVLGEPLVKAYFAIRRATIVEADKRPAGPHSEQHLLLRY